MYDSPHAWVILVVGILALFVIVATAVLVIVRLITGRLTGRPGAASWPKIVAVSVALAVVVFLLLR